MSAPRYFPGNLAGAEIPGGMSQMLLGLSSNSQAI